MDITDVLDHPEHPRRRIDALARLQKDMQLIKRIEEIKRPLRQWEELQRHLAPLRQMEEMKRHLGPFHRWEAEQKLLAPLGRWEELQKQAGLHARHMVERHLLVSQIELQVRSQLEAANANALGAVSQIELQVRSQLEAANVNSLRGAASAHERIRKAALQHGGWISNVQQESIGGVVAQELARQLAQTKPALSALAEAQKAFDRVAASFQHLDVSAFQFNEADEEAAEEQAEAITEAVTAEPTLAAAVAQLAAAIEAQQNPSVQLRLWLFLKQLMWVIVGGYISAVIAQQFPAPTPQEQPQAVKNIKVAARLAVGSPELLSEHRFVSAQIVNVRQNPKARSPKLAELRFGSVVRLERKDGDFALVVWLDKSSGAEIHGWVFSRYLKKFD